MFIDLFKVYLITLNKDDYKLLILIEGNGILMDF